MSLPSNRHLLQKNENPQIGLDCNESLSGYNIYEFNESILKNHKQYVCENNTRIKKTKRKPNAIHSPGSSDKKKN